jgi:hypothetical protein
MAAMDFPNPETCHAAFGQQQLANYILKVLEGDA